MLGGEELLRSKFVSKADELDAKGEVYAKIPKNSYENMYGNLISHNSYNSPLEVNSFKWGNKKEVSLYDGVKIDVTQNDNNNLTAKFAELIALHKAMPKYSLSECDNLIAAKDGKVCEGGEDAHNCYNGLRIEIGNYLIFVAGGNGTYFKDNDTSKLDLVFDCGVTREDTVNYSINIGNIDGDGSGFACRIYRKK